MHTLMRTALILLLSILSLATAAQAPSRPALQTAAQGLSGRYVGQVQGEPAVLAFEQQGSALAGRLEVGSHRYDLGGTAERGTGRGRMIYRADGTQFEFAALLAGNDLTLHTRMSILGVAIDVPPMAFRREGSGGTPGSSAGTTAGAPVGTAAGRTPGGTAVEGERDRRLVGSWVHSSSYTSGTFSAATRTGMQLLADGRVVEGGSRVVGGGDSGSFDSGGSGANVTAVWRTQDRVLYVRDVAGGQWNAWARYGFSEDGGTMMLTFGNGSKKLWYRQ